MTQRPIRIDQLLPSYAPHDAVGNHVTLVKSLLEKRGFTSEIFAEMWSRDAKYPCTNYLKYDAYESRDSIAIYHFSVGSVLARYLYLKRSFRICAYHNITPQHYFANWDYQAFKACLRGRHDIPLLRNYMDMTWSVSQYNKAELVEQGFAGPHLVFPVLRDYERLTKLSPDPALESQLKNRKNIVFVGRVTPHKGQYDLVYLTKVLREQHKKDVRLILAGLGTREYFEEIIKAAAALGLKVATSLQDVAHSDVCFTGSISDEKLAQIYRSGSLFISFSEHEGFCVPVVEAMSFGLPIVAHEAAAVPETLGDGGKRVDKFDFDETLKSVLSILDNESVADELRQKSCNRFAYFSWENQEKGFDRALEQTLERYHAWYLGRPSSFSF